jgi:hypothetical protein
METTKSKVAWLFVLHAVGITGHTVHDMLPLFFGGTLASAHADGIVPASAAWATIPAWAVPVALICLMTLTSSVVLRWVTFAFAVLTALPNQFHWYEHVILSEHAILSGAGSANFTMLTIVQLNVYVLCYMSWKWARER